MAQASYGLSMAPFRVVRHRALGPWGLYVGVLCFCFLQEDPGFRIGISEENADVFSSYHLAILSFKHAAPLLPLYQDGQIKS